MIKKVSKVILINVFIISLAVGLTLSIAYFKTSANAASTPPEDSVITNISNSNEGHASTTQTVAPKNAAPLFTAIDSNGKEHKLSDYKGKIVVLEWTNHKCPFVVKHYDSKNMQTLQKELTQKGVVWLSIISSAPGKQGHLTKEECNNIVKQEQSAATAVLLDETGDIGKLYKAKTTPHMFVIDTEGNIAYQGAIDSIRSASTADVATATNYVKQAAEQLLDNRIVSVQETSPYGCGVKY